MQMQDQEVFVFSIFLFTHQQMHHTLWDWASCLALASTTSAAEADALTISNATEERCSPRTTVRPTDRHTDNDETVDDYAGARENDQHRAPQIEPRLRP